MWIVIKYKIKEFELLKKDLIEKIGTAFLLATDPDNSTKDADIIVTVGDLFLLRECCQSFLRVGKEAVGVNLLRKIYSLILQHDLKERCFIEDITSGIDMSLLPTEETVRTMEEEAQHEYRNPDSRAS